MSAEVSWIDQLEPLPESAFADREAAYAEWAYAAPALAGEVFPGRMRVADDKQNYPDHRRKPLTSTPPPRPAAVELFDIKTGTARVIAVDIDAGIASSRVAAEQAAAIAQLLRMAGLHPWTDESPARGRHVQAVLPRPVAREDLAAMVRALKERYPCVDTGPVSGLRGCLRPTGSRHQSGGYQRHVGTLAELETAVSALPASDAWERLCALVAPIYPQPDESRSPQRELPGSVMTAEDIGEILHKQAIHGPKKAQHLADQSAFRYRVERTAYEAGFTQDEYVHAVTTAWTWMRQSYARKGPAAKVAADHFGYAARKPKKKHQQHRERKTSSRNPDTSHPTNPRPLPQRPAELATRQWISHALTLARHKQMTAYERWLIIVLGFFALSKRSTRVNGGLRAYALGCGISHETVSNGLRRLHEEGLIRRVSRGRAREADTWELLTGQAAGHSPAPGWIQGLRNAFIEFGPMAGELYELLVTHGNPSRGRRRRKRPTGKGISPTAALSTAEIALRTGYSASAIKEALAALAAWDLAEYVPRRGTRKTGWIAGKADPNHVAAVLETNEVFEHRRQVYARQRSKWWQWLNGDRKKKAPRDATLSLFDLQNAALAEHPDDWINDYAAMPDWAKANPSAAG